MQYIDITISSIKHNVCKAIYQNFKIILSKFKQKEFKDYQILCYNILVILGLFHLLLPLYAFYILFPIVLLYIATPYLAVYCFISAVDLNIVLLLVIIFDTVITPAYNLTWSATFYGMTYHNILLIC